MQQIFFLESALGVIFMSFWSSSSTLLWGPILGRGLALKTSIVSANNIYLVKFLLNLYAVTYLTFGILKSSTLEHHRQLVMNASKWKLLLTFYRRELLSFELKTRMNENSKNVFRVTNLQLPDAHFDD